MKASETQPDPETPTKLVSVLKKTILQPAAEIPTSSHAADSDVDASKLIIRANIPSISEILAESSSVDSGSIDKGSKGSLAAMRSPLTSPIPAPRSSSLNHRSSNTSIGSNHSRRVTFSPDVIDNSETRSTPLRPKRLSKKKSIPLKASPLSESQDLASTNASAAESVKGAEPATPVPVAVVSSDLEITSTAEAQSEPFDDTPEDSLATAAVEAIVNVEASAQRETEKEQMLLDMKGYYRGHEELWRTAIDSYVSEMNMVQVKAVLVFVLFAVYACGIISVI
ncbi:MAG: hypothetical protein J3R72DRAFT_254589 [Linnemannia gamsii]|nr:MAG: hypothetical protein J3R72DRAFT_254589 [Linnemannia gamsii]